MIESAITRVTQYGVEYVIVSRREICEKHRDIMQKYIYMHKYINTYSYVGTYAT